MTPDKTILTDLVTQKMPFGKYAGWPMYKIPEPYLVWFRQKGFPKGRMGTLLETLYEIKLNGLEELFIGIKKEINSKRL